MQLDSRLPARDWRLLSREEKQRRLAALRRRQQQEIEAELRRLDATR
ncbi:hypothetical protein [Nocardioides sp. SYSU D00038]|nr:hypothetical protein [Nocardioides sp. SYSU D00038]